MCSFIYRVFKKCIQFYGLSRISSFVRTVVAKNPKVYCTSVKIVTQPPALKTCQKFNDSSLIMGLSTYKNEVVWIIKQLGKMNGIQGFQFENLRLATTVHRAFEFKRRIQILLIECNLVSYR